MVAATASGAAEDDVSAEAIAMTAANAAIKITAQNPPIAALRFILISFSTLEVFHCRAFDWRFY